MSIFNAISEWKNERHHQHLTQMKSIGKCPECNGSRIVPTFRAIYNGPPLCPGCEGSGLYSDWKNRQ
ncbi:methionine aminopeptidase [Bacillus sp. PS06]|uniref:methionine aminopeptidase n=1 Tax=Bacillus sp. PS06 TaxID=2764176 RepID=UPI00177ECA0F|nr:methionine aminopeptidase [Bacillus sp. PS06]MBD8070527.1 methionine aminopeptidase [Bacillus sp. PS06]